MSGVGLAMSSLNDSLGPLRMTTGTFISTEAHITAGGADIELAFVPRVIFLYDQNGGMFYFKMSSFEPEGTNYCLRFLSNAGAMSPGPWGISLEKVDGSAFSTGGFSLNNTGGSGNILSAGDSLYYAVFG
jgi:hypothetical protein